MDDRYDWAQINVDKHGIPYQILIFLFQEAMLYYLSMMFLHEER